VSTRWPVKPFWTKASKDMLRTAGIDYALITVAGPNFKLFFYKKQFAAVNN